MSQIINTQVVVLGAGPAGYSAAFRAADLGKDVVIIEKHKTLGGVCLNVGCIPSKALLHVAKVIDEAKHVEHLGVTFTEPQVDLEKIRNWKGDVIGKLTGGLAGMAKQRKVQVVNGLASFIDKNNIEVTDQEGNKTVVKFEHCIIAAGSRPIELPFIPHDSDLIWSSTEALELKNIPARLAVMGGGIIGLEMATVYASLGSKVTIFEGSGQLIPAADADLIKVYTSQVEHKFSINLNSLVKEVKADKVVNIKYETAGEIKEAEFDALLVAIGRTPNTDRIGIDKLGLELDGKFIKVDKQLKTSVDNIYAVGDIVGQPMLAHKGVHEGHVAAEVIAGHSHHYFEPKCIPSIAYTEPEVAWTGLTEKEAKEKGIAFEIAKFPWAASGRAIASETEYGFTKIMFSKEDNRVLGGAMVGQNAGELLGEVCLAIEMGADAEDLALTIHAHPTLHESVGLSAEIYEGSITDLPNKKAVKK